ncbi:MAG: SxtJ family membrane protein [bacterium]
MIKEEIKSIKKTSKDIINFGLLIGGIIALIGAVSIFYNSPAFMYLIPLGMVIMAIGFIAPVLLKPIYILWMIIAVLLGFVSTRVILSILFYLIITPMALIFKMIGKDPLNIKIDKTKTSYWEYRENKKYEKIETERQF